MTMIFRTESQAQGLWEWGECRWAESLVFKCSCWSSVSGLCWADVSQEEQLSQTAKRAWSWKGGA